MVRTNLHQETRTYYNYFRDYDPSTGRYVQSDPIGLAGGINTYGYVKASPLTLIDPWGLLDLLVFDGRRLTGYDGTDIEFSVPAVSGPWGKGRLPPGTYKGDNLRRRTNKAMVCEDGNGWSLDLDPKFKTDRDLLRIHPDGNVPGTEGCIGPDCRYQQQVYDALRDYFNDKKNKQIPVIVVYPK
ncbi:MAG: RHS repeat-associated core domain-containing protein [Pseudomonadota bacterium]